jgi:ABC-type uncharacterized transport system YnjBCD ATPase subunit
LYFILQGNALQDSALSHGKAGCTGLNTCYTVHADPHDLSGSQHQRVAFIRILRVGQWKTTGNNISFTELSPSSR